MIDESNPNALWPGDTGELDLDSRYCYFDIVKGKGVASGDGSKKYATLLRNEAIIRSRLAELFIILVHDVECGYAFGVNLDDGDLDIYVPKFYKKVYLDVKSVLLLCIVFQLYEDRDESFAISKSEVVDIARTHFPGDDIKKWDASWSKLADAGFIKPTKSGDDYVYASKFFPHLVNLDLTNSFLEGLSGWLEHNGDSLDALKEDVAKAKDGGDFVG